MGCASSSTANGDANVDVSPVAKVTPAESEYTSLSADELQQKTHSMIRWSKPEKDLRVILACDGALNSKDPKNGNCPIHIASQNGHFDIVKLLIELGADLNSQNGTGQTALHMAREYDYFWISRMLIESGASTDVKNNAGFEANTGIEGDAKVDDWVAALSSAHNKEELAETLSGLEGSSDLDKSKVAMVGMQAKKRLKLLDVWTDDDDFRFKSIMQNL